MNSEYLFAVAEDFEKEIIFEEKNVKVTVPEGFYTDMASTISGNRYARISLVICQFPYI